MDVTVTGGAGFIGSALVTRLVADDHEVTVFDNVSRGNLNNLDHVLKEIQFVQGDVRDNSEFTDAVGCPDVLYHLAAINGTKNFYERPVDVMEVNMTGTRNAMSVACDQGVDRVVFASSSEVYGFPREFPTPEDHVLQIMDPANPRFSYAGSKIFGEQHVIHAGADADLDYVIVRPHNIYGEAMGTDHVIPEFIEQIVTDIPFTIYGTGKQTRSFCYINDAVDGFVQAGLESEAANNTYNIGTQTEVTINELADRLFDVAGVEPTVEHIESKELSGSTPRRQPDISRARAELGYDPAVSLDEGLRRTFGWYCQFYTGDSAEEWRAEQ
jgi:nucleoside-diphosphate-sugar epimerase